MSYWNGTCLQGKVEATYDRLVEIFGEPTWVSGVTDPFEETKVETEWELIGKGWDDENIPVTIYDWKEFDGGLASRSGKNYSWHIGGKSSAATVWVYEQLKKN